MHQTKQRVEHRSAEDRIAQIQTSDPSGDLYDAELDVLKHVNQLAQKESAEVGLDLSALGTEICSAGTASDGGDRL